MSLRRPRIRSGVAFGAILQAVEAGLSVAVQHPDFGGTISVGPYRWADGRHGWTTFHTGGSIDVGDEFGHPSSAIRSFVFQVGLLGASDAAYLAIAKLEARQ